MKKLIVIVTLVVVCGVAGGWYFLHDSTPADSFRTAPVKKGDVLATISATGTVEPEEVVDVGAQVAGIIDRFGNDPHDPTHLVDYRTEVTEGMLLAHIDDTTYRADLDSAKAAVDEANASVARAQADLGQGQAKLVEAQRDWDRAQKIGASDALSQNDYDMYEANFESAKATVAVDEAAVVQQQKSVSQYQATVTKAARNLAFCTIVSPVDGVVIDRRVNVGQTVVSSLSSPSLFLIAKDLKRMQIWASVNEADVGKIFSGQKVTFTVDAFPSRTFEGVVGRVRYNATVTSNVVTYTVEITIDNSDGTLIPYLTANVQFVVGEKKDVLTVADAALHWNPQVSQVAPEFRDQAGGGNRSSGDAEPSTTAPAASQASKRRHGDRGTVWIVDGKFVKPVRVQVGLTDGANTEISLKNTADLPEGADVITGDTIEDQGGPNGSNPFLPQWGRNQGQQRNGRGGGGGGR